MADRINTVEYFIEVREPLAAPDNWFRMPRPYPAFKDAHDRIEKYIVSHTGNPAKKPQYRVRCIQHRDVVLWSTEDGDE